MAESEASGDFDYLWDDPADVGGLTGHDLENAAPREKEPEDTLKGPGDDLWDDPDDNFWDNQPDVDDHDDFDAFNDSTWSFTSPPAPWYRSRQAMTALVAASAAVAAIVVSGVLLVFRASDGTVYDNTSSVTPTAPTSAAPVQVASSEPPPPEPPPPPPPTETAASPVNPGPGSNSTYGPRPTKQPEIGVTRTPITRLPISVAPQQRSPHNGIH